jgi:hypothetical protein
MSAIENVAIGRLKDINLKGYDIKPITRTLMVRESICTPFITAELMVLDNDNWLTGEIAPNGGDYVNASFDSPHPFSSGTVYKMETQIVDIKATKAKDNLDMKVYTISLIGNEHMVDKGRTVPASATTPQKNGVQWISEIWYDSGFKKKLNTWGAEDSAQQTEDMPAHVEMQSPLTAIGQIRDAQYYPQYPTGNVLFFVSNYGGTHIENLVPLQKLYEEQKSSYTFTQKQIWGSDYFHMFGKGGSDSAIMQIYESNKRIMLDPNEFVGQHVRTDDIHKGRPGTRNHKFHVGPIAIGMPSSLRTNTNRVPVETSPAALSDNARLYAMQMKSLPQYVVEIPFMHGLNITVGDSVGLNVLPPHNQGSGFSKHSGDYLVTDLVHEVHNDLRNITGRTVLHCLKQGENISYGV